MYTRLAWMDINRVYMGMYMFFVPMGISNSSLGVMYVPPHGHGQGFDISLLRNFMMHPNQCESLITYDRMASNAIRRRLSTIM